MPRPSDLGLPPKFRDWRKGQEKTWEQLHYDNARFSILNTPVGSGKSLTAMASALLDADSDRRTAYLTVTKQLQEQVLEDFESSGVTDIRGRDNYICNINEAHTAATAKCTAGIWCSRQRKKGADGPCDFYDQKRDAAASNIVLSNYAFWLHDEESQTLGQFHRLILDEGHRSASAIEQFASVEITDRDITEFGGTIPTQRDMQDRWKVAMLDAIQRTIEDRKPKSGDKITGQHLAWMRRAKDMQRKMQRLCRLSAQEWLCSRKGKSWRWELLNAGALAEPLLFRGASKVVLVSATVNRKTLELLGVNSSGIRLVEQDSTFPVARRPIYHWPVVRVSHGMDSVDRKRWIWAIDEIIGARQDRKGLIHSVSYARALEIVGASKFRDSGLFLVHRQGTPLQQVVDEFRRRKGAAILVSPAAAEGVDLPQSDCEYIIVPKMPFPDMRDPLIQAKKARDKDYIPYIVLQHVVQSVGRGMRSADDACESWILDGHFDWLRYGYHQYMPRWFHVALRTLPSRQPPPPPPPRIGS